MQRQLESANPNMLLVKPESAAPFLSLRISSDVNRLRSGLIHV